MFDTADLKKNCTKVVSSPGDEETPHPNGGVKRTLSGDPGGERGILKVEGGLEQKKFGG